MTEFHDQWPQYEVFIKSRNGLEHKHSSSLHATDSQHALLLARDVYTRRQEGNSLWVVATRHISQNGAEPAADTSDTPRQFEVFLRLKPGLDHKHIGSVDACDGAAALHRAEAAFGHYPAGSLGGVPSAAVLACEAEWHEPFFDAMADKTYRLPTFYQLPAAVNNM
jgi:ring-1,2-phenylacetyl-CoA epoxidase subunit PaaB